MTRELTNHKVNVANDQIKIEVVDQPGPGGANHHYRLSGPNIYTNPSYPGGMPPHTDILFQNGAIGVAGVNGLTIEALLAICEDRLSAFQKGPYRCVENHDALVGVRKAQDALASRTKARVERGVEGTMVP